LWVAASSTASEIAIPRLPDESAKLCGANGLLLGPYTGLRLAEEIVGGRPVAELAVFNPGPGPLPL